MFSWNAFLVMLSVVKLESSEGAGQCWIPMSCDNGKTPSWTELTRAGMCETNEAQKEIMRNRLLSLHGRELGDLAGAGQCWIPMSCDNGKTPSWTELTRAGMCETNEAQKEIMRNRLLSLHGRELGDLAGRVQIINEQMGELMNRLRANASAELCQLEYNGTCYWLKRDPEKMNFTEAEDVCATRWSKVADTNLDEIGSIVKANASTTEEWWTGLRINSTTTEVFLGDGLPQPDYIYFDYEAEGTAYVTLSIHSYNSTGGVHFYTDKYGYAPSHTADGVICEVQKR